MIQTAVMFSMNGNRIARFEKVASGISGIAQEDVILPVRATSGSAGYDIRTPFAFTLEPGQSTAICTGLRCFMQPGWVLMIFPRSGLGRKYRLRLDNTTGIIDSDYYYSQNQGHIIVPITNCGDKTLTLSKGESFCQGVFVPFGITYDDNATAVRDGGFGSTDIKK